MVTVIGAFSLHGARTVGAVPTCSPTVSNNDKTITIYIDNFYYTYYLSCSYILVCTFIQMSYNGFAYNTVSEP